MSLVFRDAYKREPDAPKEESGAERRRRAFQEDRHVEAFRDAAVGLPHHVLWRLVLALSVCLTVLLVVYAVIFAKGDRTMPRYLLDIFYGVDWLLHLLLTFHPKKKTLAYRERSIQAIAIDFLSLLPLEMVITYRWELNRLLRVYRPVVYFHLGRHSVERRPVAMVILESVVVLLLCCSLGGALLSETSCDLYRSSNCHDYLLLSERGFNETQNEPWRRYVYTQTVMFREMTQRGYMLGIVRKPIRNKVASLVMTLLHLLVLLALVFPASVSALARCRGARFSLAETLPLHKATLQVRNCMDMLKIIVKYYLLQREERRGVLEEIRDMRPLPPALQDQVRLDAHWDLLRHARLFCATDIRSRKKLARLVQSWHLPPEYVVFGEGQVSNRLVYVVSGTIQVVVGNAVVALLGAGSVLGSVNLFHDSPSPFTVRCVTYCIFDYMTRKRFQQLADEYPQLRDQVEWELGQRLIRARSTEETLRSLSRIYPQQMADAQPPSVWMHDMFRSFTAPGGHKPKAPEQRPIWEAAYTLAYLDEYAFALSDVRWTPPHCHRKAANIFQPGSFFLETWNKVFAGVTIASAVVVPFYAVTVPRDHIDFIIAFVIMEVLNLTDLGLLMVTAIKTRDGLVTHPRKIIMILLVKWWFYVDIITIISLFFLFIERTILNPFVALCSLLHVVRLYRVFRSFRVSRMVSLSSINGWAVAVFLLLLLYPVYFWAVLLYTNTCTRMKCGISGWVPYLEVVNEHPLVKALLHMTALMTCMPYFEIPIVDQNDMIFCIGAKITFYATFVFLVSYLTSFLEVQRVHRVKYDSNRYHMMRVMHHRKVDTILQKRVLYCLERIGSVCDYRLSAYTGTMNYTLPQYIDLHKTNHDIISFLQVVPMFKNARKDFIAALASKIKIHVLPPQALPVEEGKYSSHLFMIEDGVCQNVLNAGEPTVLLKALDVFPLAELLGSYPAIRSIKTVTNCRLYTIDFFTFKRLLDKFKDFEKNIEEAVKEVFDEETVKRVEDEIKASKNMRVREAVLEMPQEQKSFYYRTPQINPTEILIQIKHILYYIILPHGKFLVYWEISRICFAILTCLLFPLRRILGYYYSIWFIWSFMILDVTAYIDVYMRFRHAYHDKDGWVTVHCGKIIFHYLRHSFLTDVFACFPFDFVFGLYLQSQPIGFWGSILYNNRFVQIYRIRQLRLILQQFDIQISHLWVVALGSLLAIIITHTVASYHTVFTCTLTDAYMECPTYTGMAPTFRYLPHQPLQLYLWKFVYFFTFIMGHAYTDELREIGTIITICLSLSGLAGRVIVYSFAIALYVENNLDFLTYKSNLKQLVRFMDEGKVNERVRHAVIDYNEMYWLRTKNIDSAGLFDILHPNLCSQVLLQMFQESLRQCRVLSELGDAALRMVMPEARLVIYSRRCRLCRINDVMDSALVVVKGTVLVEGPDRNPMGVYGCGMMFGNLDRGTWNRVNITVIAVDQQVEVLSFRTERLHERLRRFPMFDEVMDFHLRFHVDFVPPVQRKLQVASSAHMLEARLQGRATAREEAGETAGEGDEDHSAVFQREENRMGLERLHGCAAWMRWACGFNMLHPHDRFPIAIWTILLMCAVAAYILVMYQVGASIPLVGVVVFIYFLDLVHCTAIFFTFRCGYFDVHGQLIMNKQSVKRRYIRSPEFFCDVVSVIPADIVPMAMGHFMIASFVRLNRVLRLVKVYKHLKVHTCSLQSVVWLRRYGYVVLGCTRTVLALGSALAFLRKISEPTEREETAGYRALAFFNASHSILVMLASGSLNEVVVTSTEYMLFFLVAAMVTHICWLLSVVWCCQYIHSIRKPLEKYVRKCIILENYVKARSMSKPIVEATWEYMRLLWDEWRGLNEPQLLSCIPHIMQQALRSSNYGNTVRSYGFYRNLHVDFMRQVLEGVRRCYFFNGNEIAQQGIADGCTYFVFFGEVEELAEGARFEEELDRCVGAGDVFGIVQGVFPEWPHRHTFRARSKCSVLFLRHGSWQRLLPFFPAANDEIFNSANSMYIFSVNK